MSEPSRRRVVAGLTAAGLVQAGSGLRAAPASDGEEVHGLSGFGDLAYPPDFKRFAYVNPDAPRGGRFSSQISSNVGNQTFDTFNTLNIFVLRGDGAAGMSLTFDSLMARALDEPDAVYGLAAGGVRVSADGLVYRFRIRPEARFHDGSRLTARDVAFSVRTLKERGHPRIAQVIREVEGAEAESDEVVAVRFSPGRARDVPLAAAGLPIFSEAYWQGREFEASTLEAPLGSGPYKVARFEVGRFIAFERVRDYWADKLPVNVGQNNFDEIRYEYFRDRDVAFEGFKAGAYTYREEFTSRIWATGYEFAALREGRVRREILPDATPSGTQGWFLNTRRPVFADRRVREAVGLAFDFEWTNTNLMYGTYKRVASYFENSDLKAEGPPSPEEMALLEPWRGRVPDTVFGPAEEPPRSDGSGQDRAQLRRADTLLREAGCRRDGAALRLPDGQPFAFEFLDYSGALNPHTQPFVKNLGLLGIKAAIRTVDAAQYQSRLKSFDFDATSARFSGSPTPGAALREVYGSRAATTEGSSNLAGISDPAVDALLDAVANAATRPAMTTACRALDRVLRAGRTWVPMWYSSTHRIAVWDVFGRPSEPPRYDLGAPGTWWYDAARARAVGRG